jgi:hypothetical protein
MLQEKGSQWLAAGSLTLAAPQTNAVKLTITYLAGYPYALNQIL